ncbi:MAG: ATP phosphoribosyltransferase regulatory subunit, partial [Paracoccaceae bacterium]
RFRALLGRYAGLTGVPESRARLLAASEPMADAPPLVGLRSRAEISERIDILRRDAEEPPISGGDVQLLDRIIEFRGKYPAAVSFLGDVAGQMPALRAVADSVAARMDALSACGVDVDGLDFDASYGRSAMEYYDGFVFGFCARSRDDLPPIATGGRYDALARVLGKGRSIPAVGGVIRPGLLVEVTS